MSNFESISIYSKILLKNNIIFSPLDTLTIDQQNLLLKDIKYYLEIIILNSKKIDELFNLVKLMYSDKTVDSLNPNELNNNVVKDYYLYNTLYYNNNLNIINFDIVTFLNDISLIISTFSGPSYIGTNSYVYYNRAINNGIIGSINYTIIYFIAINKKIIAIYKYIYSLQSIGIIPAINIFDPVELTKFYKLLFNFTNNYTALFNIIYNNKLNIYLEFYNLELFFKSLVSNIYEFLLYVQVRMDLTNSDITNYVNNQNNIVSQDLFNIITFYDFYNEIINIINDITNILIISNIDTIDFYKKFIEESLSDELKDNILFMTIFNAKTIISYCSYQIILYQDLNILKINLYYDSFNFDNNIINLILQINNVNQNIFNYYFETNNLEFCKELINYDYLNNSYVYINITNTNINN